MKNLPLFAVLLTLCSCASTGHSASPGAEALRNQLLTADRAFNDLASRSGLANAFATYCAEDAIAMPVSPSQFIHGAKAIVDSFHGLPTDSHLTWVPLEARADESGDFGFTVGSWNLLGTDAHGQRVNEHGKYVTIWHREANGAWKIVFDGGNQSTEPGD